MVWLGSAMGWMAMGPIRLEWMKDIKFRSHCGVGRGEEDFGFFERLKRTMCPSNSFQITLPYVVKPTKTSRFSKQSLFISRASFHTTEEWLFSLTMVGWVAATDRPAGGLLRRNPSGRIISYGVQVHLPRFSCEVE